MDLALDIYNLVVNVIGTLPVELEFIYGIATVLIIIFVIIFAFSPWILLYKIISDWG